jgi:Fe-S cluster assembly protein SufD
VDGDVWTSVLHEDSGGVTKIVAPVGTTGMIFERLSSWADQNEEGALKLSSAWTDIVVEDHATLTRIVVQDSSREYKAASSIQLSETSVRLGQGAVFRQFVLAEGAKLARIETRVSVEGEGALVELNGVYLCAAERHADLTSVIDHKVGGGTTRQLIKGVARKGGRGVFQGKIVVERGADGTDARMGHHALILGERAEVDAKPELEIYADDVQCAHGNTVGNLDEAALFYMQQRGIPADEARTLLTEAFLIEVVDRIAHEGAREVVREWLTARL